MTSLLTYWVRTRVPDELRVDEAYHAIHDRRTSKGYAADAFALTHAELERLDHWLEVGVGGYTNFELERLFGRSEVT